MTKDKDKESKDKASSEESEQEQATAEDLQEAVESDEESDEEVSYKTVFETTDSVQIKLACDLMARNGIAFRSLGSLTGASLGLGQHSVVHRLQVAEGKEEEAQALLSGEDDLDGAELEALAQRTHARSSFKHRATSMLEVRRVGGVSLALFGGLTGAVGQTLLLIFVGFAMRFDAPTAASFFKGSIKAPIPSILWAALAGAFLGLVASWIYNLSARLLGGIQLEVFDESRLLTRQFRPQECFFVDDKGKLQGPHSLKEMEAFVKEGSVLPTTTMQLGEHVGEAELFSELDAAFYAQHTDAS